MSPVVEISAEAVGGVRRDLARTRDAVQGSVPDLRRRASWLGVRTTDLDEALGVADRLGSSVLPVVDAHLRRAQDLERMHPRARLGTALPVLDLDVPRIRPQTSFTRSTASGGGTTLSWDETDAAEVEADAHEASQSRGVRGWFSDRWSDTTQAVSDGADWVAGKAGQAWDAVTDAGAAIGDWWESTTASLGGWIDENLTDLRDFIGRHVGVFRFLASACRVIGWVVVVIGAVLTIGLAIIGAMGGAAIGAVFGFGVGAVPGGAAGAAAGAAFGLKILGAGFALVAVGDFLDVAADWGEGKIDGQQLVQRGALELGLAVTSFVGAGVIGKGLQRLVRHMPTSWRQRMDDRIRRLFTPRRDPLDEAERLAPLRSGAPSGPGWTRGGDYGPDPLYGRPRPDHGTLQPSAYPQRLDPGVRGIGGDLDDLWGTAPTGRPFTETEWAERFTHTDGSIRWPPNGGAVPGTRVLYDDAESFVSRYGNEFDRIGGTDGGYLGVPPGTSFGERALPPGSLGEPLTSFSFTGDLPPGIRIEVSEIAPGFGRPGGGLQVRFMDGTRSLTVDQLRREGVLR